MKTIDLYTWERATQYKFFRRMDYPHHSLCTNIDITNFLKVTKSNNLSFYYSMIHATITSLNTIENFRYRIRDEDVVLHEVIHPSFTDIDIDSELFKMVSVNLNRDIKKFVKIAKEKSQTQKEYFDKDMEGRDDLIYFSCNPWVSFTGLTHTISLNKNDSVPRISWGKYFYEGDKTLLPFSVQVHHSFVDGFHVGKYINALQEYLNTFKLQ